MTKFSTMINKDLLLGISEFDEKKEGLDHQEFVDNLDLLEKAQAKLHSLLITTRMTKLMSEFGQGTLIFTWLVIRDQGQL
jgi:hypothetical protein